MLRIDKGGLQTTVQDLGRRGVLQYGVIASGVMDPYSYRAANILVGNRGDEAALEITLIGPCITFLSDCLIAITGADLSPSINDVPVGIWRPVYVKKGSRLAFGKNVSGCRAYLAVSGGIDVPEVMGSCSTYLRASIGGFKGRGLQKGDIIPIGRETRFKKPDARLMKDSSFAQASWRVSGNHIPVYSSEPIVRVTEGRQADWFNSSSLQAFYNQHFEVTANSDRMGYRLNGPHLKLDNPAEMLSEAVSFGSVQVPPDGQPIVLMADRQTVGGYPKIAQIATVDLPRVGQLKPGDTVRFRQVPLEEAQSALIEERNLLKCLEKSVLLKLREEASWSLQ